MKHSTLGWLVMGLWLALLPRPARAVGEVPLVLPAELDKDQLIDHTGERVLLPEGTRLRLRHQAHLILRADAIVIGKDVVVDGRGEPGAPGTAAPPRTDEWVSEATEAGHQEWVAAGTEEDRGAAGMAGQDGLPGATLELQGKLEGTANLHYEMAGGTGGEGGAGGRGRPLRCGLHPTEELKYGPTGFTGVPGLRGAPGQVLFSNQPEPLPRAVALTISGGISLGNYEAGYNWALVRHLKTRRPGLRQPGGPPPLQLVATTGASAGSINTLLTAIAWCQKDTIDDTETASQNLFYQTWTPIGLQELIPSQQTDYGPEDAVLSRQAFQGVQQQVIDELGNPARYQENCTLQVGMNVTRQDPELLSGGTLEIPVDRYAVALEARSGPTGLSFYDARQQDENAFIKTYLHLTRPTDTPESGKLETQQLVQILTASSAFPVAFGLQPLDYYVYKGELKGQPDYRLAHAYFWDGGLYDNIPLSLSLSLLQKPLFQREHAAAGYLLHAVDLDRRRTHPSADVVPIRPGSKAPSSALDGPLEALVASPGPQPVRRGLGNLGKIAGNFFSVARKYELQSFMRFALPQLNAGCQKAAQSSECLSDPLTISSRFSPVFGERLGAFGAFMFRAFREFDFAAGVYDSLYLTAESDCQWEWKRDGRAGLSKREQLKCLAMGIHDGYQRLRLDSPDSVATAYVVRQLFWDEARAMLGSDAAASKVLGALTFDGQDAHTWATSHPDSVPRYMPVLFADIHRAAGLKKPEPLVDQLDAIQKVAKELRSSETETSLPEADREILRSRDWFAQYAMHLLARAERVEEEDQYPLGQRLTGTVLYGLRTLYSLRRLGLDLDPSSVPDETGLGAAGVAHLIPYHAGLSNGMVQAGWRPTLGLTAPFALVMPLSLSYHFKTSQEPLYRWGIHGGAGAVVRLDNYLITSVEASLRGTISLDPPDRRLLGAEVALYVLAGKLRLSVVMDDFAPITHPLQQLYFTVGLADLNGLIFHLVQ